MWFILVESSAMPDPTLLQLIAFIRQRFDLAELHDLCVLLQVNYDDLGGSTLREKARELVLHMERRGRLEELQTAVARERPKLYRQAFLTSPVGSVESEGRPTPTAFISSVVKRVPAWALALGSLAVIALAVWVGRGFVRRNGEVGEPKETAEVVESNATRRAVPTAAATAVIYTPAPYSSSTSTSVATATTTLSPTATIEHSPIPTSTETSQPQAGHIRLVLRDGIEVEQVYVPTGSFMMGSEDGWINEVPVHEVKLDAFWLDRTEVTNAQFATFVQDTGYVTVAELNSEAWQWLTQAIGGGSSEGFDWKHPRGPESSIVGLDQHPAVQVTWDDAVAYCEWADNRLPTEAEWEYAARGPGGAVYAWGNEFEGTRLNYCDRNCPEDWYLNDFDDGYPFTAPVGAYPEGSSWVGALDLSGNVNEWVNDLYDQEYYARLLGNNPTGPVEGMNHVLRGGAWNSWGHLYTYTRAWSQSPLDRGEGIGFRCVQSVQD